MPTHILMANIKYLRNRKQWTQQEIANLIGVKSYTTIDAWEAGVALPQTYHLLKLSHLFGCTIDSLCRYDFTGKNNEPIPKYKSYLSVENI